MLDFIAMSSMPHEGNLRMEDTLESKLAEVEKQKEAVANGTITLHTYSLLHAYIYNLSWHFVLCFPLKVAWFRHSSRFGRSENST